MRRCLAQSSPRSLPPPFHPRRFHSPAMGGQHALAMYGGRKSGRRDGRYSGDKARSRASEGWRARFRLYCRVFAGLGNATWNARQLGGAIDICTRYSANPSSRATTPRIPRPIPAPIWRGHCFGSNSRDFESQTNASSSSGANSRATAVVVEMSAATLEVGPRPRDYRQLTEVELTT
jgi:hypothetical protein